MKFELSGSAYFEAKNIDDAFKVLEKHFYNLRTNPDYEGSKQSVFLPGTDIILKRPTQYKIKLKAKL